MKCPKCQNEINIYKGVACNNCGYNVLSRPAEPENQASSTDEHVEKPKQKKVRPKPEERSVLGWYAKCWVEFGNFSGRARRMEYWSFQLVSFLILVPIFSLLWIFFDVKTALIASLAYLVLSALPNLAVTVRRLHDSGKSGAILLGIIIAQIIAGLLPFFILPIIVSIICTLVILAFMFEDSSPGVNKWGDSPRYPSGVFVRQF